MNWMDAWVLRSNVASEGTLTMFTSSDRPMVAGVLAWTVKLARSLPSLS